MVFSDDPCSPSMVDDDDENDDATVLVMVMARCDYAGDI